MNNLITKFNSSDEKIKLLVKIITMKTILPKAIVLVIMGDFLGFVHPIEWVFEVENSISTIINGQVSDTIYDLANQLFNKKFVELYHYRNDISLETMKYLMIEGYIWQYRSNMDKFKKNETMLLAKLKEKYGDNDYDLLYNEFYYRVNYETEGELSYYHDIILSDLLTDDCAKLFVRTRFYEMYLVFGHINGMIWYLTQQGEVKKLFNGKSRIGFLVYNIWNLNDFKELYPFCGSYGNLENMIS